MALRRVTLTALLLTAACGSSSHVSAPTPTPTVDQQEATRSACLQMQVHAQDIASIAAAGSHTPDTTTTVAKLRKQAADISALAATITTPALRDDAYEVANQLGTVATNIADKFPGTNLNALTTAETTFAGACSAG